MKKTLFLIACLLSLNGAQLFAAVPGDQKNVLIKKKKKDKTSQSAADNAKTSESNANGSGKTGILQAAVNAGQPIRAVAPPGEALSAEVLAALAAIVANNSSATAAIKAADEGAIRLNQIDASKLAGNPQITTHIGPNGGTQTLRMTSKVPPHRIAVDLAFDKIPVGWQVKYCDNASCYNGKAHKHFFNEQFHD